MENKDAHSEGSIIGHIQLFPDQSISSEHRTLTALAEVLGATNAAGQPCFSLRFRLPNRSAEKIIDCSVGQPTPLPADVEKMIFCGIIFRPPDTKSHPGYEYQVHPAPDSFRPSSFTTGSLLTPCQGGYWLTQKNPHASRDEKVASFKASFILPAQQPAASGPAPAAKL